MYVGLQEDFSMLWISILKWQHFYLFMVGFLMNNARLDFPAFTQARGPSCMGYDTVNYF